MKRARAGGKGESSPWATRSRGREVLCAGACAGACMMAARNSQERKHVNLG